jgi:hypothetical protein
MITAALTELLAREPFRPFALHVSDGMQITVDRREQITVTHGGRIAVVTGYDESESIVALDLVALVEVFPPKRRGGP